MLASITPLGERGRHQRWGITVTAHAVAAALGGAAIGLALSTLGALIPGADHGRLITLGIVLLSGVLLDVRLGSLRVPSHRRQVDEQWLHRYRGWVYGAGFGAQLGTGIATVVTTSAVYATLAGCLLAPSPVWGCAVGAAFGLTRGSTLFLTPRISDPRKLALFHKRLTRVRGTASRSTVGVQSLLGILALASSVRWRF